MAVQSVRGDGGLLVGLTVCGVPDIGWLRARLEEHDCRGGGNIGNAIRMVTLVNPGNPTGVSLPYAFLEQMMQLTKEHGVWLVVDNTYEHFDVEGRNRLPDDGRGGDCDRRDMPRPEFPCFDEEHVINIFSFSKGYAMAGFRVGYVALSSKNGNDSDDHNFNDGRGRGTQAYEEMLKVQDMIAICTSRISQMAALGGMRSGRAWVGRAAIMGAMSTLEDVGGGSGAMYVMGKLPNGVDDQMSEFWSRTDRLLLGAHVLFCIIFQITCLNMPMVIRFCRNSQACWWSITEWQSFLDHSAPATAQKRHQGLRREFWSWQE
jgi:hypothetical protein